MKRRSRIRSGWGSGSSSSSYGGFAPYVPVAERRKKAASLVADAARSGKPFEPIAIEGRAIATTVWGRAFCDHLEHHADAMYRLERGRTYVRNGSVVHLAASRGRVDAKVMGSSLYTVAVTFEPLPAARWKRARELAAGRVGSLLDLLAGRVPGELMQALSNPADGLFPRGREMSFSCTCPDYASVCKHVAAVLYGVAARADTAPQVLFQLRGVDPSALVTAVDLASVVEVGSDDPPTLDGDLEALFGIELDERPAAITRPRARSAPEPIAPARGTKKAASSGKKVTKGATKTPPRAATVPNPAPLRAKKAPSTKSLEQLRDAVDAAFAAPLADRPSPTPRDAKGARPPAGARPKPRRRT